MKIAMLVVADGVCLLAALLLALLLRYENLSQGLSDHALAILALVPFVTLAMFWSMGVYRNVLRFAGSKMTLRIALVMVISTIMIAGISFLIERAGTQSRGVFVIYGLIGFIATSGIRFVIRQLLQPEEGDDQSLVIIYGAGVAGVRLVEALRHDNSWKPVAFVDDNPKYQGMQVADLPVLAPASINAFAQRRGVDAVFLAVPSVSADIRRQILERVRPAGLKVLTVPTLKELVGGLANFNDLRQLDIEDLIDRTMVTADEKLLKNSLANGCVLVTGAGGSIGSELCRQILSIHPTKLVAIEQSEFNLYSLEQELNKAKELVPETRNIPVEFVLGDVCDRVMLEQTIRRHDVKTIFHAAAYKHVPIVESNVAAGTNTNVLGTYETARAAELYGVERFVLISTDKAALPTSVMGASKRLAELMLFVANENSAEAPCCRFSTVRFGNVLASSGSVIPLFRSQIESGGPVTVTDKDATRYFMTIPEAAELVLQSAAMSTGEDLFVLDMGKPFNILELAKRIIELSGATLHSEENPDGIEIKFTGLRPGENLHEKLFVGGEVSTTAHPQIMKVKEQAMDRNKILNILSELRASLETRDTEKIRGLLKMTTVTIETSPDALQDILHESQANS